MDVADAVTATQDRLVEQVVSETDARPEVVVIGINQATVIQRTVIRLNYRIRLWVVVREPVLILVISA